MSAITACILFSLGGGLISSGSAIIGWCGCANAGGGGLVGGSFIQNS